MKATLDVTTVQPPRPRFVADAEAPPVIACGSPLATLSCLLKSVENLNASLDLSSGLHGVADLLRRSIAFDTFAVLLFDDLGQELRYHFAIGVDDDVVEHWRFGRGQGVIGTVAATGEMRLVRDVREEARYIGTDSRVLSELAVPLVSKNRTIGVLDVCSFQEDFFENQHVQVLQLVAGHLATAIENSRLYSNLRRQTQMLSALHEASRDLTSILDRRELLARVAEIVRRQIGFSSFNVLLWHEEEQELRAALADHSVCGNKFALPLGHGICGTAAALRQPIRVANVEVDPRYENCGNGETRSELVVPLVFKDRLLGVLDLESKEYNAFCEGDEQFLSTLASYVAIALENSTLYELLRQDEQKLARDLRTARGIQKYLLPNKTPWVPGLQIASAYTPARDLGGDIYDILSYGNGRTALAIGDVAGKGTAAALYGSLVIGQLRGYVREKCDPPLEVLGYLNEELGNLEIERRFVAMTFAVFDPNEHTITLANAGLPYPYLLRRGEIREIELPGVPVGSMKHPKYHQTELALEDGDVLVFASDGIVELLDGGQEAFGEKRFEKALLSLQERSANRIADGVMAATDRFLGEGSASDDRTVLVLKVAKE